MCDDFELSTATQWVSCLHLAAVDLSTHAPNVCESCVVLIGGLLSVFFPGVRLHMSKRFITFDCDASHFTLPRVREFVELVVGRMSGGYAVCRTQYFCCIHRHRRVKNRSC